MATTGCAGVIVTDANTAATGLFAAGTASLATLVGCIDRTGGRADPGYRCGYYRCGIGRTDDRAGHVAIACRIALGVCTLPPHADRLYRGSGVYGKWSGIEGRRSRRRASVGRVIDGVVGAAITQRNRSGAGNSAGRGRDRRSCAGHRRASRAGRIPALRRRVILMLLVRDIPIIRGHIGTANSVVLDFP